MLFLTLFLLVTALCNAEERSNPQGITLAPRGDHVLPTLTLAPVTSFNESLPATLAVSVTGAQIEFITDAPSLNGDAVLVLGPDAVAGLEIAYEENCPNGLDSPGCEASLQLALNVDQQQVLQKRVIPFIIYPIVVAVLAIEYAEIRQYENAISTIRMPSQNVKMLSSVTQASTVVFATASSGSLITVVPSPTVDAASLFSIATITVDSVFAQKGDVIYNMPPSVGYALAQFVQTFGRCFVTRKRSCDQYETAGYIAYQAILQVEPGGLMEDLIHMPTDISLRTIVQPLLAQLPTVILFGKQVTLLAANSALLNVVANFLLQAAWAELTTTGPNPTQLLIPADIFSTPPAPQETGPNCPQQIPNCSNCGGNSKPPFYPVDTSGLCVGVKTAKYPNYAAGCVCVDPNDPPVFQPYNTTASFNAAQAALAALAAYSGNSTLSSSQGTPGSNSTRASPTV